MLQLCVVCRCLMVLLGTGSLTALTGSAVRPGCIEGLWQAAHTWHVGSNLSFTDAQPDQRLPTLARRSPCSSIGR